MQNDYPRDLIGYGQHPPAVRWPGLATPLCPTSSAPRSACCCRDAKGTCVCVRVCVVIIVKMETNTSQGRGRQKQFGKTKLKIANSVACGLMLL